MQRRVFDQSPLFSELPKSETADELDRLRTLKDRIRDDIQQVMAGMPGGYPHWD